jgi:hypothetical protein
MLGRRMAAATLTAVLFGGTIMGALAQDGTPVPTEETDQGVTAAAEGTTDETTTTQQAPEAGTTGDETTQQGGAAGLVAAVVQVADTIDIEDSTIEVVSVEVDRSLNNLKALNNVLNNSPILSENNIEITDLIEVEDVNAVIAIGILDGGDIIIFEDAAA